MEINLKDIVSIKLASHKTPEFKEEKSKEWVIYGTDRENNSKYYNNYGKYLDYLVDRSSKHNAFINGAIHYICGAGIGFDTDGLNTEQLAIANKEINKKNSNGDTLKDVIRKCVIDKKRYGGFYLEIIPNKVGNNFEILHMNWNSIRIAKEKDGFFYSKDWSKPKQDVDTTGLTFIDSFNPEKITKRSIFHYFDYRPNFEYYPLPDYMASAVYAEVDIEISNYRLNAIKSGFNAGTIINFNNGALNDPNKQDEIEEALKKKFQGTDIHSSLLLIFNRDKNNAATISRLAPQNVDEQLDSLNDQTTQELVIGHRMVNPMLVGIKTAGELGGNDQIDTSYQIYKNTVIAPFQSEIEAPFNYLMGLKGFEKRIYLKEVKPTTEVIPFSEKIKVMTRAEIREEAGLPEEDIQPEVKPVVSSTVHRFGEPDCCNHTFEVDDDEVDTAVEYFRQYGEDLDNYEFVNKKYIFNDVTSDDIFRDEIDNYAFDILEGDVKLLYRNILELLNKDPLLPNTELAKALKTPLNRVNIAVERLIKDGAINIDEKTSGDEKTPVRKPTEDAITVLEEQGSAVETMRIMYTYEPRPGLKPLLPTSREFCQKLIKAKKIFTRQQIEAISSAVGYDVWTKRGGWYTQKGGAVTTPFCRHVWVQNLVRKKK